MTNKKIYGILSENVFLLLRIDFIVSPKVTIHEVAKHAGVSVSSVSRALNDYPHVSKQLKERVLAASRELGYQPDFLAHSLRRGVSNSIGFLVGTIANPVVSTIYEGAAEALAENDYAITLVSSRNKAELDNSYLRLLANRQVSGLIVSSAADSQDQSSSLIGDLGIPTVMLDRDLADGDHVYAVQSDHKSGITEAMSHLVENGHQDIAFIGGPQNFFPTRQRFLAYELALKSFGLPLKRELVGFTSFTEGDAMAETLLIMRRKPSPSAIIVAGNITLVGVLNALRESGLIVGEDIALIACDDTQIAQLYQPPLTTIFRDLNLLGKTAARILLNLINEKEEFSDRIMKLPTQLIVRGSTNYSL